MANTNPLAPLEYEALRATIRQRGTARLYVLLAGLVSWAALAMALPRAFGQGSLTLVPLLVLAATFEINFFIHTGVERIGRYIQVFYEEAAGSTGWEATAMKYGTTFPVPNLTLDPLFVTIFSLAAALNLVSVLMTGMQHPAWIAILAIAHLVFAYRLVTARKLAATQRAIDLDRFRKLISK